MKILNPTQIKAVETKTINTQKVNLINLIERSAEETLKWLKARMNISQQHFTIICGVGNNGGSGLALARLLYQSKSNVKIYLQENNSYSLDNLSNQKELRKNKIPFDFFNEKSTLEILPYTIIIDCIFGIGLTKVIDKGWQPIFDQINQSQKYIISLDMPSGLFCNQYSDEKSPIIQSNLTLTFQHPKLALLLPENEKYTPEFDVLNIDLENINPQEDELNYNYIDYSLIRQFYSRRSKFAHKGMFGNALIIGGSYGKIGALILASKSVLKAGGALVTAYSPKCGYNAIQTALPEAMVETDFSEEKIIKFPLIDDYNAISIGVGLGTDKKTELAFEQFLEESDFTNKQLILDADALNLLAKNTKYLKLLPQGTLLTPNLKELERLIGSWENDFDKLDKAKKFAAEYKIMLIIKGAHSTIINHLGEFFFNSTGNPGMATTGSGDVLTGLLTGLIAKGMPTQIAAIFGTYLHGLAGDFARNEVGEESLIASNIIEYLPEAFNAVFPFKSNKE